MVKSTLLIALLYFVSPIAIASFQAKTINNEAPRQEFFQPARIAASPEAKSIVIPTAKDTVTQTIAKTEKPAPTQTLCAGLSSSPSTIPTFCAAYLPEANLTMSDLESSGSFACEQAAQPELQMEASSFAGPDLKDISAIVSLMNLASN